MQYRFLSVSEVNYSRTSFWQGPIWSDILTDSGQAKEIFYYGNSESTYLLIEIRSVGLGFFGAFALGVSSFQIDTDWEDFLSALQGVLREKGVLFFQMEPIEELANFQSEVSQLQPYKKFITPYTRVLDISLDENELLQQMTEKGRYNIRVAVKRGVCIERAESTPENIEIWMQLLTDTVSRDGFSGNNSQYYETFIRRLEQENQGGLYFARFEGRVIAGGIFVFSGDRALYYYGASSSHSDDRKVFAPYLLQWEAISLAKSRHIAVYDFLGISPPNSKDDSLAGVSFFKSRFGGQIVELPKKVLYPLSWKYNLFSGLQRVKKTLKH